jgi:hypothetical protein
MIRAWALDRRKMMMMMMVIGAEIGIPVGRVHPEAAAFDGIKPPGWNVDFKSAQNLYDIQWEALFYEHHDFFTATATHHPAADPAFLSRLATGYQGYPMPARFQSAGSMHLELPRHRRPESQGFMLAFIYLAY